jgi:DNA modification methylase
LQTVWSGAAWAVHQGEALALLAALPTGSVGAVVTDPPYSSGGQFRSDRAQNVHTKYVQSDSVSGHALAGFSGDNRDQRAYAYWSTLWLSEALRVTATGGACVLFTDWRQLPTTTDALQAGGWIWRGVVPWHKPNGRMMQGRPANSCEYAVWGTNGPRAFEGYETLPGFVTASSPRERLHVTQKPLEVMRLLVRVCPVGATVLDPFMGSGTTGVAALIEGRRFLGFEQEPAHVASSVDRLTLASRLDGAAEQGDLFDGLVLVDGSPADR